MKIAIAIAAVLLVASASAANVETCVDSVKESVAVLKNIQTELFKQQKYNELIQQFKTLKNYVQSTHFACKDIKQTDLVQLTTTKFGSGIARCATDVFTLIRSPALPYMDETNYRSAVQALVTLVKLADPAKASCSKVTFVAKS